MLTSLESHSAQGQELRNMNLVPQEALRETIAARKQLGGLKQLTNELHQTQRDVLHYKERANQYQLGLLRTEAHLKKTKNALWEKQMENMGLKVRVKSFEEGRQGKIRRKMVVHGHEGVLTDMADGSELEVDSASFKQQSEFEDQIAQLREELQVRSEELQQLKREIQQAKTGKDVGSKLLETGLQLEKVSKANEMKQVINETLSRHLETLAKALKDAKMELAYEKCHHAGPVARAEKETNTDQQPAQTTGDDEAISALLEDDYGQQALVGPGDYNSDVAGSKCTVTKTVDHRGGHLELECGARMTIPPGALPIGVNEIITFTLEYNRGCVPGQVTPVARCLPTGLKFKKPVTITVPNLKEQVDEECVGNILCNEKDVGQSPVWKESYNWIKVSKNDTTYHVTHFSDYVTINGKKFMRLRAVAYASKPDSSGWTQPIRVYIFGDGDKQAEQEVEREEAKIQGDKKGFFSFLFPEENNSDMTVHLATALPDWKTVFQSEKIIPFEEIWHLEDGYFLHRQFMLMNSGRKNGDFHCSLTLSVNQVQTEKKELAQIYITNPVKVDYQEGGLKQYVTKVTEEVQTMKTEMNQLKVSFTSITRVQDGASSFLPPGSFHVFLPMYQPGATMQQLPQSNQFGAAQRIAMQQLQPSNQFGMPHTLREGDQQQLAHTIPQTAPPASASNATPDPAQMVQHSSLGLGMVAQGQPQQIDQENSQSASGHSSSGSLDSVIARSSLMHSPKVN